MYRRERIKGHEDYMIDTNGVVYTKRGKPFKTSLNPRGYEIVTLMKNGTPCSYSVHRLVLMQFDPCDKADDLQVNHIDGVHNNNKLENLEWVTPQENMFHAKEVLKKKIGKSRSKPIAGKTKLGAIVKEFDSLSDAARYYSQEKNLPFAEVKTMIWRATKGYRKSCFGVIWKYI